MSKLSLSQNPHEWVISHIERYGGKLWLLEFLSSLYQENPSEFDAIWIKIGPNYTPMIIPPWEKLTQREFEEFSKRYGLVEWSQILVRWSIPGDYRSLVDVIPTRKISPSTTYWKDNSDSAILLDWPEWSTRVETHADDVNSTIESIEENVHQVTGLIGRYAELSWVPFSQNSISFGIIPLFSYGHIIITEHPNVCHLYIEEQFAPHNYRPFDVKLVLASTVDQDSVSHKVSHLLELLRKKWVLDSNISYSFELWKNKNDEVILYQIRELCKKVPIGSPTIRLKEYHSQHIATILTTIPIGESKIFELGNMATGNIDTPLWVPVVWHFRSENDLWIQLDPNRHWIFSTNAIATIGGHGNMRQAQYALQSNGGWIVVLWKDSPWNESYTRDIEETFGSKPMYDEEWYKIYGKWAVQLSIAHISDGLITIWNSL